MLFRCRILATRWRNPENGWSVLAAKVDGEPGTVSLVGFFPEMAEGETVDVEGDWTEHPKYGRQIKATSFKPVETRDADGVRRFFASGRFRNIGQARAAAIADHFGPDAVEILKADPGRIREVPGIGRRYVAAFVEDWEALGSSRDVLLLLTAAGVGAATAQRICGAYGNNAMAVLRDDPYLLCEEVWGVGFAIADRIARSLGTDPLDARRQTAAILRVLGEATGEGHLFLRRDPLLARARDLLAKNTPFENEADAADFLERIVDALPGTLDETERERKTVRVDDAVYLPRLYRCEKRVAEWALDAMRREVPGGDPRELAETLRRWEASESIELDPCQREAILKACGSALFVLTGGPGTGKTTTLRGVVALLRAAGRRILLAAPTGRAAKRMTEVISLEAKTIHRLLEYDPVGNLFGRNADNPFADCTLVVDESSMIDVPLMASLVAALGRGCSLMLVGDADQLPSVGPGTLFRDLLECPQVPSARLDVIHRQGADSEIPVNAMRIHRGEMPEANPDDAKTNFHLRYVRRAEEARELLVRLVTEEIPMRFGVDPMRDVQVLLPMHKGILGTESVNEELQRRLNSASPPFRSGDLELRRGDRVMQQKNDYDHNIFNGDLGTVAGFDPRSGKVQVDFGELVELDAKEMRDVKLAYACTIHKSQGSEYPVVAIALDRSHAKMLQRTLLYTAVTRAKSHVFLIGTREAVAQAVRHEPTERRNGRLSELLASGNEFFSYLRD